MMILIYTHEFPTATGGVGSFTFQIAEYLSKNGFNLLVLTYRFSDKDNYFDKQQKFRIIRMPQKNRVLANYLISACRFIFILLKFKPKIIFATDILSQRIISFLSIFMRFRKLFVLSHGSEIIANYNENGIKKILFTFIYQKADLIIANSRYTKNLLLEKGVSAGRIKILNPGISAAWFKHDAPGINIRDRMNLGNVNIILTVARLSHRKGQDVIISLMPCLLNEISGLKYLIVGEGEERLNLEKLVSIYGLNKDVIFAGRVPQEELIGYYDACDIFVMPSRSINNLTEGFGISFIEAGARGKPAIGTKVGGIEDAVVDAQTGYLLDPDDSDAFYAKISYLLKNREEAQKLGKNAQKYVYDKFCWDHSQDCFLKEVFRG